MPDTNPPAEIPPEVVAAIKRAERRQRIVTSAMWLLGLSAIAAGVGLRVGVDVALVVTGGLVWGEYFVGGLVELIMSRKGAK